MNTPVAIDSAALSKRRYSGILTGAFTSFLSRTLLAAINLLPVSLALPYLGKERFGAWAAITTLQLWLQLADCGLAAGVTTPIARALARGETRVARTTLSATLLAVAVACASLFVLAFLLLRYAHVASLLHFQDETARVEFENAALIAVGITLIGTPNAIITRVLQLQGRPHAANGWLLAGQLLSLIAILFSMAAHAGLVILTTEMVAFPAAANVGCALWFFSTNPTLRPKREPLHFQNVARVWRVGIAYTAFQFAWMLLLNSSIFIAASVLSPTAAAEYSVTNRLASLCTVPAQLVSIYFWTAYTDAIVRADFAWVRRAFLRHVSVSVAITAILALSVLIAAPVVIERWTHAEMRENTPLLFWSLAWQLVNSVMNPVGSLLNAYDRYTVQTVVGIVAGVAAVVIGRAWAMAYGVSGLPAATTLAYLAVAAIPISFEIKRALHAFA